MRLGHGVVPAYFSQHEAELDERGSVLDCVQSMTGLRRPEAQNLLGRFLFSGWEAHEKPVAVLSGGERRRLALAVVVASGANFLVLDEPTNHLDLESREALEAALENFPATVLLVSHDRALLDAVAERTLAIEDGDDPQLRRRLGRLRPRPRRASSSRRAPPGPSPRRSAKPKATAGTPQPKRPSELERIEAEIAAQEETVAELERQLAEDWGDVELLAAHRPRATSCRRCSTAGRRSSSRRRPEVGSPRMSETRDFLRSIGLPPGDLNELPDSAKRFPDGAQYRIEIPSTEGPRCLEAVLEEAERLDVTRPPRLAGQRRLPAHRRRARRDGRGSPPRPASRSASSRGRTPPGTPPRRPRAPAGGVFAPAARGQEQVVAASTTRAAPPTTASAAS